MQGPGQGKVKGRRPRWWHGNLFKAFYWACVGQPHTLGRKVDNARQKLTAIQAKEFRNTGEELLRLHLSHCHCNCTKPTPAQEPLQPNSLASKLRLLLRLANDPVTISVQAA